MEIPFMDIDRSNLQVIVNSYLPGTGLAWQRLFPLRYTPTFDLKAIEGNEGIPVSADHVAFNTKAPQKTRVKVGSWNGKLAKIAVSRVKDEIEINQYLDLQTLAAQNQNPQQAQYLVDVVYDDVDFCNKAMDYRVEIDAMEIGSTAKKKFEAEYEGDDMASQDEINFNIPEKHLLGASVAWTKIDKGNIVPNDQADPILDIISATDAIAAEGLPRPRFAIIEKRTFDAIRSNSKTATRLYPQAKSLALITSDMVTLGLINQYMATNGYPQFLVIDTYATIQDKKGNNNTIKPWNANVVTLSPTENLGYTYWKEVPDVPNTEAIQAHSAYYKTTRYGELNPMSEITMAEAYVQPALANRASLVFINTANTEWNEGAR